MEKEEFMKLAINKANKGIKKGQTPFGACIVNKGKVISCEHNTVWKDNDITAHAEINAIRKACKKLKTVDLSGSTLFSTTEPCPMCFSACHWAKIEKIIYGAFISDAKSFGFNELEISDVKLKTLSKSKMKIESNFMRKECVQLFKHWAKNNLNKTY